MMCMTNTIRYLIKSHQISKDSMTTQEIDKIVDAIQEGGNGV